MRMQGAGFNLGPLFRGSRAPRGMRSVGMVAEYLPDDKVEVKWVSEGFDENNGARGPCHVDRVLLILYAFYLWALMLVRR